jgi:hypothetical protein
MVGLELERVEGDRRLYAVEGVGTLRLEGVFARRATVDAGERTWRVARRGLFGRDAGATDADGTMVGKFEANALRRGGTIRWHGDDLVLRAASSWRERYVLVDGERELAVFESKGWGRRPVRIGVDGVAPLDEGLLLFTAFVVRGLAEDAGSTAGIAAVAPTA